MDRTGPWQRVQLSDHRTGKRRILDSQCHSTLRGRELGVGGGIEQYSVRLAQLGAKRVYALDLTRGVDIGRRIVAERYPELSDRIVFVQGDARQLPFRTDSSGLTMALASIHYSGDLEKCMEEVVRVTAAQRKIGVCIYAKHLIPIGDSGRTSYRAYLKLLKWAFRILYIELLHTTTIKLPNWLLVPLLRVVASNTVYRIRQLPIVGRIARYLTPGVNSHPDKGYRLINLYDAYSPNFAQASDDRDIIRWTRELNFSIREILSWRLGFVGEVGEVEGGPDAARNRSGRFHVPDTRSLRRSVSASKASSTLPL